MKNENISKTKSEERVYNAIRSYQEEHSFPPTARELMDLTGYKSASSIHDILLRLERKGYIKRIPKSSRAIQIIK